MLAFQTFTASFGFRKASRDQNHRHSQTKKYPPAAEDLLEAGALGLVEAPKKSRSDASSSEEAKAGQFSGLALKLYTASIRTLRLRIFTGFAFHRRRNLSSLSRELIRTCRYLSLNCLQSIPVRVPLLMAERAVITANRGCRGNLNIERASGLPGLALLCVLGLLSKRCSGGTCCCTGRVRRGQGDFGESQKAVFLLCQSCRWDSELQGECGRSEKQRRTRTALGQQPGAQDPKTMRRQLRVDRLLLVRRIPSRTIKSPASPPRSEGAGPFADLSVLRCKW